jgi:hypothetical protein
MDPYLETRWSDVHAKLVAYIGEALQPTLPRGLRARSEERVLLEEADEHISQSYRSDIAIVHAAHQGDRQRTSDADSAVAVQEPYIVTYSSGPQIDRFVQILDSSNGNRVVTAIEVLSPWYKSPGRLNQDYLKKLDDYARAEVSVVEIDLLRSPRGRLLVDEADLPLERRSAYFACVRRGWLASRWEVYSFPLRAPLAPIKIPLRRSDPDAILHLQPLIDRVYVAGGHDDIDYSKPPFPPLSQDDQLWAEQVIKKADRG